MPTTNLEFAFDLTLDEVRRRSAVLEAIGADWDPIRALAEEEQAYAMLYSNLDDEQQRLYDALVSAGVLPDRAVDRASD
ncbi:DUF6400 family protein [Mycobacterium sp.]|uniref:DUF6400 family protein n=1 Tax=Mycobacterium sp. TaxID=1785 RepID=UPI003D6B1019